MTSGGARAGIVAGVNDQLPRDLHDVVAHQVSIVAIQANAAQRLLVADPAGAARALRSAEATAAEAVADLDRLCRVLRAP
jgi:signal transduction histidine kinase